LGNCLARLTDAKLKGALPGNGRSDVPLMHPIRTASMFLSGLVIENY